MFSPGQTVLVSVSGGPDSTCLLHALFLLRRLFRIRLRVFHFDHRLRPDSGRDAAYVRRLAARLGLPLVLRSATGAPPRGASVEDWAHGARFTALRGALRETAADRAAVGHTLDDQAETVLLALIRGGGLEAVAGIRPVQGPFVRPLIEVTRDEVAAFVRALRLRPRLDPTNRDTRLLRNAVRLRVMPGLERAVGREVRATLARTASLLREDAEFLEREAAAVLPEVLVEGPDGVALRARGLTSLPRPVSARVARASLLRAGVVPAADHVEALLDLATGRPGRRRDLPGGLLAVREREYVRVSRPSPEGAVESAGGTSSGCPIGPPVRQ